MKALDKLTNTERAYLFEQLFPDDLQQIVEFINKEAELFIEHKDYVYSEWDEGLITADFWYSLVANCQISYLKNGNRLHRNPRTFRDQLFDGYDALFSIHALLHYTEQPQCSKKMKYAIYFLFGESKLINIDLTSKP